MIANCRINELGKASGGRIGDNNGQEYRVQPWYNFGQKYILRYPDSNIRNLIANYAEVMANKNVVGYDQAHRASVWAGLANSSYDPNQMTTLRSGDCSSTTTAIVKAIGYKYGIEAFKNLSMGITTASMVNAFKDAGFTVLSDAKYLTSDKSLVKGDIILAPGKHVVVNITDGPGAEATTTDAAKPTVPTVPSAISKHKLAFSQDVKDMQWAINQDDPNNPSKLLEDGYCGPDTDERLQHVVVKRGSRGNLVSWVQCRVGAGIDGKAGENTVEKISDFQAAHGIKVDGRAGHDTIICILRGYGCNI